MACQLLYHTHSLAVNNEANRLLSKFPGCELLVIGVVGNCCHVVLMAAEVSLFMFHWIVRYTDSSRVVDESPVLHVVEIVP